MSIIPSASPNDTTTACPDEDSHEAAVAAYLATPYTDDVTPAPMKPEQRAAIAAQIGDAKPATDALIGSFAESVANVRTHEHPSWEDLYCMNLTSYMGERMAPVLKRLLDTETENARLRAQVAELKASSPWERAVAGLNALVDADIAFWIEPDGHISGPFGDEHIEWDQTASRWRLVHDDEAVHPPHPAPCRVPASPDCTCPVTPEQARRIERDRPETATSHDCNLPLTRRLDCGHCPHEVCQDCDRCPHACRCASPEATS
ncbi:hypothetical protein [Streptomyces sp. NPDC002913]